MAEKLHTTDVHGVHTREEGFDHDEPRANWILILGIGSLVLIGVMIGAVHLFYEHTKRVEFQERVAEPVADDLVNLREREDAELNRDAYVDKAAGKVRISIDRAIDLLAKEYAEGRLPYSTAPAAIKAIEPAPGGQPAPTGQPGQTQGGQPANAPAPAPAK